MPSTSGPNRLSHYQWRTQPTSYSQNRRTCIPPRIGGQNTMFLCTHISRVSIINCPDVKGNDAHDTKVTVECSLWVTLGMTVVIPVSDDEMMTTSLRHLNCWPWLVLDPYNLTFTSICKDVGICRGRLCWHLHINAFIIWKTESQNVRQKWLNIITGKKAVSIKAYKLKQKKDVLSWIT